MTATATQVQPSTGFWLSDALGALGSYAAAYANNRLAYESAKDDIELYRLQQQAQMGVAGQSAAINGGIPQTIAGVPAGVVLIVAVLAIGGLIWAAR